MSAIGARTGSKSTASGRARTSVPTRTHVASACSACRQRRCKCSGGLPCTRCKATGTECTYNEFDDKRTKAARDRERGELGMLKKIIEAVFQAIRGSDQYGIVPLIRQNAPLSAIAAALTREMTSKTAIQDENSVTPEAILGSLADTLSNPSAVSSNSPQDMPPETASGNPGHELSSPELGIKESLEATVSYHSPQTGQQSPWSATSQQSEYHHTKFPLHFEDTSSLKSLSSLYTKFRDASQHVHFQDMPNTDFHWDHPVACDLLFRDRDSSDLFTISAWAAAVVNNFPELDLFFRLAWLVLLTRFMRWSIAMDKECFSKIPDIMKPTMLQTAAAHPPFIDLVPLPQLRDALMRNPINFATALSAAGVSVGWDAPLEAAVVHDSQREMSFVTDAFERHIAEAFNYRFGKRLLNFFPDLEGKVNFSEEEFIWPTNLSLG